MEKGPTIVGWRHEDLGSEVMLALQTRQSLDEPGAIEVAHLMLSKNQAAGLASYLLEVSGQTGPMVPREGWLKRMFG